MSNDSNEKSAAGLENDAATERAAAESASEISSCMAAVIAAAIDGSKKPGLALTAVQLALHALRSAIIQKHILTAEEAAVAVGFADHMFLGDTKGTSADVAAYQIDQRSNMARPTPEDVENTVREATATLADMQRRDCVHPITQLLVLHTTRQIVVALMKHRYPDQHEEMLTIARAMENGMLPHKVEVIDLPAATRNMSKGGSA